MPPLAIILPVKNEEKYIRKCLESLINQDFPKDKYEIIIIDGMSTDNTLKIVKEFQQRYPKLIKVLHNPKERQVYGANIGIKSTSAELIAYISGHSYFSRNWLKVLYQTLSTSSDDVAGVGSIHVTPPDQCFIGKAIGEIFYSIFGGLGSTYRPTKKLKEVYSASFVLYRRSALEKVGYFDERIKYAEDYILNMKLRRKGYKLLINPNAVVYYYKRESIIAFIRQIWKYSKGKALVLVHYPSFIRIQHFVPSIALVILLLLLLVVGLPFVTPLIVAYLLLILVETIFKAYKNKEPKYIIVLPILYILEHITYSVGFIVNSFYYLLHRLHSALWKKLRRK